ncbi:MAG: T9SS type A sorting domain-containing protein [Bacteroidota bacterium]
MTHVISKAYLLLVFLLLFFSCQVYSQSLQDGLLIHYKFDGDSLDYSGNGYNPTLFRASYTEDVKGNLNSALYFDGVDDLIIMPDIPELKPNFPITISFWIKMDNITPESNVYFTNDFNRFAHSGVWLNLSTSHKVAVSYGDGSGFGPYARRSKLTYITLQSNVWHLISSVLWSANDIRIYVDGIEEPGYEEGSAFYLNYVGAGGNIGRKDANYQLDPYFYKGSFDDFRYWDRGLSDDEILSLYDEVLNISDQYDINTISIYPNPAYDYLFIKTNSTQLDKLQIYIFDMLGKRQISSSNTNKINIQSLKKGIYSIRITTLENMDRAVNKAYTFIKN